MVSSALPDKLMAV
ncbi:hypothetical protein ECEC1846_2228, partial [Escherichia coli EC1846]